MEATQFATASREEAAFRPIELRDGYLPIQDYGLIGDGTTAALVGRDGTIAWLCLPRFDRHPIFSSILDRQAGGRFAVDVGTIVGARHRYFGDSSVLITELKTSDGIVRITDMMPLRREADLTAVSAMDVGELLRVVEVLDGEVTLRASVTVQDGVDVERTRVGALSGVRIRSRRYPAVDLVLEASAELDGAGGEWTLEQGHSISFCLRWNGGTGASSVDSPIAAITNTVEGWLGWLQAFRYVGPQRAKVQRSAITIKMLDYLPNGAIIAAPTSSLPEHIGGERNWDYRYVWVRDAAFAVYALRRIGMDREAWQFLSWVLGLARDHRLNLMYTLDGEMDIPEREDRSLEGYRRSAPVRWGNGAHGQLQHDVFGELLDCAFMWSTHGGRFTRQLWDELRHFVNRAAEVWDQPDQGIWEVRTEGQVQTYSAGICQVALDRGAKLARRFGLEGEVERWERTARQIQETILEEAWDEEQGFLTQGLRGGHLDASILGLPLRRALPATHPRVVATVEAVDRELGAGDGLIYRYRPNKSPDGLSGDEGAFVLCSFWLIDNLVLQGRLEEAQSRFDRMCERTSVLGLLPEEIDPATGDFLGNFPQAFSHIGLISSGFNLTRALREREAGSPNGQGSQKRAQSMA
jgi:GH15 family glucan-1,4-alpha-glucosidase